MCAKLLWQPSESFRSNSNLSKYMEWLKAVHGLDFSDYSALWQWSVTETEAFWGSLWEYFSIIHDGEYASVMTGNEMPGVSWFEGTRVSYAEHIFRNYRDEIPAMIFKPEGEAARMISWKKLRDDTSSLQKVLTAHGRLAKAILWQHISLAFLKPRCHSLQRMGSAPFGRPAHLILVPAL
jgi:acetoacetyl-CoA synthetase